MSTDSGSTPFRYQHSANFPALLEQLGMSLAVTTYQAGKLMIVRSAGGKLSTLLRSMERPMGIAMNHDLSRMVVGTRRQVWTLRSAPEIAPQLEPKRKHDACYVPRLSHVTGNMQGHEIAVLDNEIWIVNTLFSCLCVLDDDGATASSRSGSRRSSTSWSARTAATSTASRPRATACAM